MKYLASSVIFTSLALSSVVRASKAADEQAKPTAPSRSSFWSRFGFGKGNQDVPTSEVKGEQDDSWTLVNVNVVSDDDYDFQFEKEHVVDGEIKAHRQEMHERALKRHDEDRLARVKEAEEDEMARAWMMPGMPRVSTKWYEGAAPSVALQEVEGAMLMEASDMEGEHELDMHEAEEAVLMEEEAVAEDEQPVHDEEIPQAPPMEAEVVSVRAPVYEVAESVQKPKDPKIFHDAIAKAESVKPAASTEEATLIQRFTLAFGNATGRDAKIGVVKDLGRAIKGIPKSAALDKLFNELSIKANRSVYASDNEEEEEEGEDFD